MTDLDRELARLYGLPLEEFTAARNELAAGLRKEGERDAAEEVKALAKPTLPLWVVNRLALTERVLVDDLMQAGEGLREAQKALLAGGGIDADAMSEATAGERQVVGKLMQRARAILADAGRPASTVTLDRVASTLRAAAVDEEGRRQLARGWLTSELEVSGFEALSGFGVPAGTHARRKQAPAEKKPPERRQDGVARRIRALRAELKEQEQKARAAEREADRAEAAAAKTRARAAELRRKADAIAARLREFEV
jgi:hypothetical protein